VTGPVRSGKSTFASRLADASGLPVTYIATAARDETDVEWRARLEHHAASRNQDWRVVETETMDRSAVERLFRDADSARCLLLDSIGGWLTAQIFDRANRLESDFVAALAEIDAAAAEFANLLLHSPATVIAVGEQTGWGIVPHAQSARAFRDVLGRLDQRLARDAEQAYVVIAGYALDLKRLGIPAF